MRSDLRGREEECRWRGCWEGDVPIEEVEEGRSDEDDEDKVILFSESRGVCVRTRVHRILVLYVCEGVWDGCVGRRWSSLATACEGP